MENPTLNPGSNTSPATGDASTVKRSVDSAGSALHSTIDKVADPARNTVDRVASAAHQTVDKLASGAGNVADRFSEEARWVTDTPARVLDTSKSWVQDKPLEAVGLALALGFILGRLTAH